LRSAATASYPMNRPTFTVALHAAAHVACIVLVFAFRGKLFVPLADGVEVDVLALVGLGLVLAEVTLVARLQVVTNVPVLLRFGLEAVDLPVASYLNCIFSNETPSPEAMLRQFAMVVGVQLPTLIYGATVRRRRTMVQQFSLRTLLMVPLVIAGLLIAGSRLFSAEYGQRPLADSCLSFCQGTYLGLSGAAAVHLAMTSTNFIPALVGSVAASALLGAFLLGARDGGWLASLFTPVMTTSALIVSATLCCCHRHEERTI
jgi:hypothetical protein